jgi:hypothetical protein
MQPLHAWSVALFVGLLAPSCGSDTAAPAAAGASGAQSPDMSAGGQQTGTPVGVDQSRSPSDEAPARGPVPVRSELGYLLANGKVLDSANVDRLLQSESFDLLLARYSARADAEGLLKSRRYASAIGEQLHALDEGYDLGAIACDAKLCLASVRGNGQNTDDMATLLMAMSENEAAPMYSTVLYEAPPADAGAPRQYRIAFTTERSVGGISVPAR